MSAQKHVFRVVGAAVVMALLIMGVWMVARSAPSADLAATELAGLAAPSDADLNAAPPVQPGPPTFAPFAANSKAGDIIEIRSEKNDVTKALRDLPVIPPKQEGKEHERENPPLATYGHVDQADPVVQTSAAPQPNAFTGGVSFEGINQAGGCGNCAPPDTNGDVGPNHYVQTVNTSFAVWNKTGSKLYGPAAINTVWQGFGGACQTRNDGDPVMLYDSLADRWLISQFTATSPYYECIAISQTGDPTGAWYRYAFQLSTTDFPDYPKFGVWPDGYYMSANWFTNGTTYGGPRPFVFDRAKMLAGQPATLQTTSSALGSAVNPILPADLDGATLPPSGAPGLFLEYGSSLNVYKFAVNWTTPAASTWTRSATLSAAAYTTLCSNTRSCVPQKGTTTKVDGIGDRLMNRLVYRNMGGYESLLASHSVNAGTRKVARAGMRWYEIRNPLGTPSIYQQGTYAPADGLYRWMGSVAMDKVGDIALGYSASNGSNYPSIRYTARIPTDALGTMGQGEATLYQGTGSQSGVSRWGDYSNLSIDPVDGCTFWYTQEYNNSFGWAWGTRIGSFKVAGCQ
jgi:hypothetical protein